MASGQSDGQRQTATSESRLAYWRRVLRPLYWWILLVLVLYGIRLHERMMEKTRIGFTISLQGKDVGLEAMARLDGKPVVSGQKISLGHHTFTITQPKAVAFSTNFFAWYGGHDFGQIRLQRTMGTLQITASPAAQTVTVNGPEFSTKLHEVTATNLTVPADTYIVGAKYAHWAQTQTVSVYDKQSAFCTFAPRLGAVRVTCNKDPATCRLASPDGAIVDSGDLPATITSLPVGSYQMTVEYHNQQIQKSVLVETGKTNQVVVQFLLGAAHIESDPTGADVRDADGHFLGQTPLDVSDLKPQTMQLNLSRSGYQTLSLSLNIAADRTNSCHTNLLSLRYVSAMQNARQYLAAGNYDLAIKAANDALDAKPMDGNALQLHANAAGKLKAEQECQERLKRPQRVFDDLCAQHPYASLFEEHVVKTGKPAKTVAELIVKSLQAQPGGFQIMLNDSPETETYRVVGKQESTLGILGGSERLCLLVVGQTKDNETQILFRVLEYQVQHTIQVSGLFHAHDEKQLIPLDSSRMQMTEAMWDRVREGVRLVMKKIQQAIRL